MQNLQMETETKNKIKTLIGKGIMLKDFESLILAEQLAKGLILEHPDSVFLKNIIEDKAKKSLWPYIEVGDILRNIDPYENETRQR